VTHPGGERWIAVGRVGRPHGLGGAFVVEQASEAPERLAPGAVVYVGREPATVVEAKRAGGRLVARLDRPVKRGAALELPESELPAPDDDAFYVFQLVGLTVEEEGGRRLGTVRDVAAGVANDVLELDSEISLPFVGECVRSIDVARGRIVVAPGYADPDG
jgi:16S rRNA processing protein RimM